MPQADDKDPKYRFEELTDLIVSGVETYF